MDNPLGYELEAAVSEGSIQSASKDALVITLPPMTQGHDKTLEITIKTKNGGRLLLQHSIPVALVDFETRLDSLMLNNGNDLTLTPPFHPDNNLANGTVYHGPTVFNDEAVSLEAIAKSAAASVTIIDPQGKIEDTGRAGRSIALNADATTNVTIQVASPHGASSTSYQVNITRNLASGSSDAYLAGLTVSEGTLEPAFNPLIYAYTVTLESDKSTITLTGQKNQAVQTLEGDHEIARTLGYGENNLKVVVRAENTVDTREYTVKVLRKPISPVLSVGGTGNQFILSWPAAEGATDYVIYYSLPGAAPDADTLPLVTQAETGYTYTITESGNPSFWVRAKIGSLTGNWSASGNRSSGYGDSVYDIAVKLAGAGNDISWDFPNADVEVPLYEPVSIPAGKTLTIKPPDNKTVTLKRTPDNLGALFQLTDTAKLYLGEPGMSGTLILDGGGIWTDANGNNRLDSSVISEMSEMSEMSGIVVEEEAYLINVGPGGLFMYDKVFVQNNNGARAIHKAGTSGSININGGTIRWNKGGAVSIASGTLNMSGGEISQNLAFREGWQVVDGGGIYAASSNSLIGITGAAKITYNAAQRGGGIYITAEKNNSSRLIVNGTGVEIDNNNASYGGGIYACNIRPGNSTDTVTVECDNGKFRDNWASPGQGTAICFYYYDFSNSGPEVVHYFGSPPTNIPAGVTISGNTSQGDPVVKIRYGDGL
jgi:hypothetical protein